MYSGVTSGKMPRQSGKQRGRCTDGCGDSKYGQLLCDLREKKDELHLTQMCLTVL